MGKTNRNTPARAGSSEATTTLMDFDRMFPDDATCLDWLVSFLYPEGIHCPKCDRVTKHHRVRERTAYACQFCGHQEYPMKGTIFQGSSTSLRLWFYGIYLMASTRGGISAKQLEREIGVSYPTAHRMFKQIRSLLDQDDSSMSGTVEMDETYVGGKPRLGELKGKQDIRPFVDKKAKVFGMVERGGQIAAHVVPSTQSATVMGHVQPRVLPGSMVYTDESPIYKRSVSKAGYEHKRVHHRAKVFVDGDVHTQTIDGFWALFKGGLGGVYHAVSEDYLQSYVDEYVFRYNYRKVNVFEAMMSRIGKAP